MSVQGNASGEVVTAGGFTMTVPEVRADETAENSTSQGDCFSITLTDKECFDISVSNPECFFVQDDDDRNDATPGGIPEEIIPLEEFDIWKIIAFHSIGNDLYMLYNKYLEGESQSDVWLGQFQQDKLIDGGISSTLYKIYEYNLTAEAGIESGDVINNFTQMYMYKNEGFSSDLMIRGTFGYTYAINITGSLKYTYPAPLTFLKRNLLRSGSTQHTTATLCPLTLQLYTDNYAETFDTLTFTPVPAEDHAYPDKYYYLTEEDDNNTNTVRAVSGMTQAWDEENIRLYRDNYNGSAVKPCLVYTGNAVDCGNVEYTHISGGVTHDYSQNTGKMFFQATEAMLLPISMGDSGFSGTTALLEGEYMYFANTITQEWTRLKTTEASGRGRTKTVVETNGDINTYNIAWNYDGDTPVVAGSLGCTVSNGYLLIPTNTEDGAAIQQLSF